MADKFKPCLVELCNGNAHRKAAGKCGYCSKHYQRLRKKGDVHDVGAHGKAPRFFAKHVEYRGEECIPWPFWVSRHGYGYIGVAGRMITAHRHMCETVHGPASSDEYEAAHSCGNRSCINPNHLSWKTPAENAEDKKRHGTYLHGETGPNARLTPKEIIEIRSISGIKQSVIAEYYSTSQSNVSSIRRKETWSLY